MADESVCFSSVISFGSLLSAICYLLFVMRFAGHALRPVMRFAELFRKRFVGNQYSRRFLRLLVRDSSGSA